MDDSLITLPLLFLRVVVVEGAPDAIVSTCRGVRVKYPDIKEW
jgi:hypothetical protein